jgi:hypothetical protein
VDRRTFVGTLTLGLLAVPLAAFLLFSLVASGQIKLRKIDAWRKIAALLSHYTAVAA